MSIQTMVKLNGAPNSAYGEVYVDPNVVVGVAERKDIIGEPRVTLFLAGGETVTVEGSCALVIAKLKSEGNQTAP